MDLTIIARLEWISNLFGVLSMPLNMYRRIEFWYVNIVISLLTIFTSYHRQAYSRCLIGLVGIAMSCYGWYNWQYRKKDKEKPKPISTTSSREWLALFLVGGAVLLPYYFVLCLTPSPYPLLGAVCTIMVFLGMWLSAEKKLESSLFWGTYNLISICQAYLFGSNYIYKYLVYVALAPYTYYLWKKEYKKQKKDHSFFITEGSKAT